MAVESTSAVDQTVVFVTNGGDLTLAQATISSSGNSSSTESSSFYGLNAAVIPITGGTLDLFDSTIDTTGIGANDDFSGGAGSSVGLKRHHQRLRRRRARRNSHPGRCNDVLVC
jgi:hypothetical protein